jgi:CheY-like chemotaxis protein
MLAALIRRTRALPEPGREVPALALSAFARERDRQRAREAGFDGHLAKPIDPDTLLRTLTELLGRRPGAATVAEASDETEPGAVRIA